MRGTMSASTPWGGSVAGCWSPSKMSQLYDCSFGELNVGPAFRDGLASRLHIGKDSQGRAGGSVHLASERIERDADRLVGVGSWLWVIFLQQAESCRRLIAARGRGEGFS